MKHYFILVILFLYFQIFTVFAFDDDTNIKNNSALQWIQSNEYNLSCQQIFTIAKINFDRLLKTNSFSKKKPLAIISDIDETILLNYKFEVALYLSNKPFSYKMFGKYINKKSSIPIHGSIAYYRYLASRGIEIFYISNRLASVEQKTFEHLKELGYPIKTKENLLLMNEKTDWTSDKSSRRKYIMSKYNVVQIFGDNIFDFIQHKDELLNNKDKFGKSWFLLPNPIYGNWLYKKN
jgi:acid phosphatase